MAFLDNSGDIILDAVLTDTGRMRLARGDGSFKIAKYALGDDEIDYESYNAGHLSGSAYYDLEILQTPIFEAFTNNTATMKTKLVSLSNNNLLYLPIMKINDRSVLSSPGAAAGFMASGSHVCFVNETTGKWLYGDEIDGATTTGTWNIDANAEGYIDGSAMTDIGNRIRVDQGLDTSEVSPSLVLDPELKETQYIVEIDSRFAKIYDKLGSANVSANPSFIDDDSIATYYFTQGQGGFVGESERGPKTDNPANNPGKETILGPRGTRLTFGLLASTDLVSSNYLFTTLGTTLVREDVTWYFIDSTIRVTGVTTGYRLDIPIRFLKVNK